MSTPRIRFFSSGQYVKCALKVRANLAPLVGDDEARKAIVRLVRTLRADADWKAYNASLAR